jgi:hypothetical protein
MSALATKLPDLVERRRANFASAKRTLIANAKLSGDGLIEKICRPYYGLNISQGREPIDQLDMVFLAKKLGVFPIIYVAGMYGLLNGNVNGNALMRKEEEKMRVIRAMFDAFGVFNLVGEECKIFRTADLWGLKGAKEELVAELYWAAVGELMQIPGIIEPGRGPKFGEILSNISNTEYGFVVGSYNRIGMLSSSGIAFSELCNMRADGLYTLFEVAEALTLKRYRGVDCKWGPESENRYDRFIGEFMSIMQFYQPLSLNSVPASTLPVIPYMERKGEERIFLDDGKKELIDKLYKTAQRANKTDAFWEYSMKSGGGNGDIAGKVPNPFVRAVIYAVEAAECMGCLPIRLRGKSVYSSEEALKMLELSGASGTVEMVGAVSEALWNYILRPIQEAMK